MAASSKRKVRLKLHGAFAGYMPGCDDSQRRRERKPFRRRRNNKPRTGIFWTTTGESFYAASNGFPHWRQRINIRINVFEEMQAQPGCLRFVEMKTVEDVQCGKVEDFNFHASAWQSVLLPSPNFQTAPCLRAPAVHARRADP